MIYYYHSVSKQFVDKPTLTVTLIFLYLRVCMTAVLCSLYVQWSARLCVYTWAHENDLMEFTLSACVRQWPCGVYHMHMCDSNSEGGGNNDPTVQTHSRGSGGEEEVFVWPDHSVQQQQGQQEVSCCINISAVFIRVHNICVYSMCTFTSWQSS